MSISLTRGEFSLSFIFFTNLGLDWSLSIHDTQQLIVLKIFLHLQGSHQSRHSTQPWSRHLPNGQYGVWPKTLDGQHWRWRHIFTGRYNEGLLYSLQSSSCGEGNKKELMETNPSHCSCWRRGRSSLRTWRPRPTRLPVPSWGRATTTSR